MYDWELERYIAEHNGVLNHIEYSDMCNTSPQLNHIKYDPYNDCFEVWSDQGNYFRFKVYYASEPW